MFCTQCGHQNPEDSRFCGKCGAAMSRQPDGAGVESTSTISLSALEGALDAEAAASGTDEPAGTPDSGEARALEGLPPGSALLVVKRGPNAGSRFLLDAEVTTAGRHPVTPWGVPTLGYRTRKKNKASDRYIVRGRRRGKGKR